MSPPDNVRFGLTSGEIDAIQSVLRLHPKISRAILYGSRAKGTYRPGSDIDLTLQGEGLTLTDLLCISNELDDLLLPYTIDLSLFDSLQEPTLLAHIARIGVELFSRSTEGPADFSRNDGSKGC
jgi:predicted nucleotidyltransferase